MFVVEISKSDCEKTDDGSYRGSSWKRQPNKNNDKKISVVALNLKLFRLHSFLHVGLHLLLFGFPNTVFLQDIQYDGHRKGRVQSHSKAVECNLVPDLQIPGIEEVFIWVQGLRVAEQIAVSNEVLDEIFEWNAENVSL